MSIMSIDWITRAESSADIPAIRDIVLAAFETPSEADLVDALRADSSWLDGLSIVATDRDGRLVGHALLTRCHIGDTPALCLAPVAVLPEYQKTGAGSAAIRTALQVAKDAGRALRHRPRAPGVLPEVRFLPCLRPWHRHQHRRPGRGHDGPRPRRRAPAAQRHRPLRRTVRHLARARRAGAATRPRRGDWHHRGMSDLIIAACDGAAKKNPGPAAWAWVVADADGTPRRWEAGPLGHPTNNVAELTALAELLESTDPALPLEVRMDSQYAMNAVTKWIASWKRNGWLTAAKKPVANKELVVRIDALLQGRAVTFRHVAAHQVDGDHLNAIADVAASDAATSQQPAGTAHGALEIPQPRPERMTPPAAPRAQDPRRRAGQVGLRQGEFGPGHQGQVPRPLPLPEAVRGRREDHEERARLGACGVPGRLTRAGGAGVL